MFEGGKGYLTEGKQLLYAPGAIRQVPIFWERLKKGYLSSESHRDSAVTEY